MTKIKNRFNIIIILLGLIFSIMAYKLFEIQIVNGMDADNESQHKLLKKIRIIPPRGNIYDRNGIPLATDKISYSLEIAQTSQSTKDLNKMLLNLDNILEKNSDVYESNLSKYLKFNPIELGSYLSTNQSALKQWKKEIANSKKDLKKLSTPEAIFKYLRFEKYKIDSKYSDLEAYKIMGLRYQIQNYSIYNAVRLATDINQLSVAEIEEKNHLFPGVSTLIEPKRVYSNDISMSHVIGYISNINSDEYSSLVKKGYYMNDHIGKTGIEKSKEGILRGKDGIKIIESDILGLKIKELNVKPSIPGENITLTIDSNIQRVAFESLLKTITDIRNSNWGGSSNHHDTFFGSAVAVDVNSGEVLALVSYPGFDTSIFTAKSNDMEAKKKISALLDPANKETSQYNRAISGIYPPGSTYKPLVGLAGLEEGVITKKTIINDPGITYIEGTKMTCMEWRMGLGAHGNIRLRDALRTSCNMFFYKLGIMIGIDKIDSWAKKFGFGEKTQIELPGESQGIRANIEYHKKHYNYKFGKVLTAHAAIGQSYNAFTPVQLASFVSTIASRGKKYNLHLVKSTSDHSNKNISQTPIKFEQIDIKNTSFDAVQEGMVAVANSGTAAGSFKGLPYTVAAKTGTAETYEKGHSDNAVFIAYAPADKPKIAVAILVERGVYGAYTAPIARNIFEEYFKSN